MAKSNWRKRTKGTPRQRGKAFKLSSSNVKGAKGSKKYKPSLGLKIIKKATGNEKLKKNEWYALKVTDDFNKYARPRTDYENWDKGWIGWEKPSNGKPYISKKFKLRHDLDRGDTFVVEAHKTDGTVLDH